VTYRPAAGTQFGLLCIATQLLRADLVDKCTARQW